MTLPHAINITNVTEDKQGVRREYWCPPCI